MTMQQWLNDTAKVLRKTYGLDKTFASKASTMLAYFYQYGLNPKITSGFRSPEYQKELQKRYAAGDRSVVVAPATNSKHSITKFGQPAAQAIDISTNNQQLAARIAVAVGVKPGLSFSTPDGVHFYA